MRTNHSYALPPSLKLRWLNKGEIKSDAGDNLPRLLAKRLDLADFLPGCAKNMTNHG
jgi:hypothetical protein